MVNRHGAVNYTDWTTTVRDEIVKPSPIELSLTASINGNNINITTYEMAKSSDLSGKLQVWVIEDGITTFQFMPDGSTNKDYKHHNVFRTSVNGTWGNEITLSMGEEREQTMIQPINNDWNRNNLSIVAFYYDESGVLQATKTKVTTD